MPTSYTEICALSDISAVKVLARCSLIVGYTNLVSEAVNKSVEGGVPLYITSVVSKLLIVKLVVHTEASLKYPPTLDVRVVIPLLQVAVTEPLATYVTGYTPKMSYTKTNSVKAEVASVKLVTGVLVMVIVVPTLASSDNAAYMPVEA